MNERIRLLAEQAKFAIDVSNDPNSPPSWWAAGHNDRFEKFAELIVQECILTIQMGITRDGHNTEKYQRSIKHLTDIKKYFGIEDPKGWICPKCGADRTKIACPLGFGATVDGRCPMTMEAQ